MVSDSGGLVIGRSKCADFAVVHAALDRTHLVPYHVPDDGLFDGVCTTRSLVALEIIRLECATRYYQYR